RCASGAEVRAPGPAAGFRSRVRRGGVPLSSGPHEVASRFRSSLPKGRVLIDAQMSAFGDEAEILCSTRALPVLTWAFIRAHFCLAAQRPSGCGRLKAPVAPGGLRETAGHSKPEPREPPPPKADEAEAQHLANTPPPSQCNCCRSASASHCTDPRTG